MSIDAPLDLQVDMSVSDSSHLVAPTGDVTNADTVNTSDTDLYGYSGDSDFEEEEEEESLPASSKTRNAPPKPPIGLQEDSVGSFEDDSKYGITINGIKQPLEVADAAALEGTEGVGLDVDVSTPQSNAKAEDDDDLEAHFIGGGMMAADISGVQGPSVEEVESATRIQQLARARTARKHVAQKREEKAAAIHIQRMSRSRSAKKRVQIKRAERKSAIAIQKVSRSRKARRVVAEKRHVKKTNDAAIKVQAQHRRRMGAKAVQVRRERHALETESAVRLQSITRGGLERKALKRQRDLEEVSATRVQNTIRARIARKEVERRRMKRKMIQLKKEQAQRRKWAGLNKPMKSPYNALLTYKGIKGRNGGGGIGLDAKGAARSRMLKSVKGGISGSRADAVLIGGPSLLGNGSSSPMQTPLISLDPVADDYGAKEIELMVNEASSEIMMLAQNSVDSIRMIAEGSLSESASINDIEERGSKVNDQKGGADNIVIPETTGLAASQPFSLKTNSLLMGGGSAILEEMEGTLESQVDGSRVDEMRRSIDFIKERFNALKQISQLDPVTAAEGGWTEEAVEEELKKLKKELAQEREKLREALYAASPALERRSTNRRKNYNPNLSASSTMSASRERLFSEEVAQKLLKLTKKLDRTCKMHDIEVRRRRDGEPLQMRERFSPLISHKLHPSPKFHLKPLFRGDKSPEGILRQRRRARASIRGKRYRK